MSKLLAIAKKYCDFRNVFFLNIFIFMCLIPWPQNPVAYRLLDSYLGVPLSRENRRLNILIMHKYSIVFKCRNGLAPPYLIDSFNANTFNHSYSTRNSSNTHS